MPPNFYNAGDQAIYSAGDFFIPQERYRAAPYTVNQPTNPDEVPAGIPTVYQPQGGGGGGYTGGISDLTGNFFQTTSDRQDRLTELNRPLQAAQFPSFPGAKTAAGSNANTLYNQAFKDLNDPSLKGMSNDFVGKTAQSVMDYADDSIQDYKMKYATGELGPNYIPAETPTFNRKINDFIYDKLGFTKPQSADQILEEGYNKPYGSGGLGILGTILGKMDNYSNLSAADQAFIAKNMGYTGPTVFGANESGLSKDPFGLNTRSAFGNYAERVGVESEKLGDALSATGAIGGKAAYQGATFNPATGMFEADDDDRKALRARANEMVKSNFENMVRMSFTNLFAAESKVKFKNAYEAALAIALETPVQGYIAANEGMRLRPNRLKVFKTVKGKQLLILGQKDILISVRNLKSQTKDTKIILEELSEGHMSHIENKSELSYFLRRFIEK